MRFILISLLVIFSSCSSTKPAQKAIDESQISAVAKKKLDEARELVRAGKLQPALLKIKELNDNNLTPIEKALKYNLKGVTIFNLGEADKALLNFQIAEKYTPKDSQLFSQVQLNMASAYYKLNQFADIKNRIDQVDRKSLTDVEVKKYAQVSLAYGEQFKNDIIIVTSSVLMMGDLKTSAEVVGSSLYEPLKEAFKRLNQEQKIHFLEEFNDSNNLAVAHLAQVEADDRYMKGDKEGASDVVAWLRSEFGSNPEVSTFIKDFETRVDNASKISVSDIGLVLPLSGDKAQFAAKALSGVDTGLKVLGMSENVKVHTKDSQDNPAQGAQAVADLIKEKRVAFIIGGLFPESAKAEYLEAKKYGVVYISLSQINLPKEEKNHHLIEVQGSIESQVETLLSEQMIAKFGSRIGVIYPDTEGGKAYVDEIWRKSEQKKLSVTSIASFPKNTHDFRDPAQLFLGLKYPRERSEELKILDDVYSLEKSSIRRVQTLPPVIDFDWVFLATYPHEATQLIPTLGYYDANHIKVIGGPSWVSKSMVKEQKNLGTLFFVGDDPKDLNHEMLQKFQEIYGKPAGLLEIISLDAMKIGVEALIATGEVSNREEFDSKLKSKETLKGLTTAWNFKEGVWLKKMNAMTITRGEIVKLFESGLN